MTAHARARLVRNSGGAFLVLLLIALLTSPPHPEAGASAREIARHFAEHSRHIEIEILIAAASLIPALVFLVAVADHVRQAEEPPAWWSRIIVVAGSIALASTLAASVPHGVLAMDSTMRDPPIALALFDLGNVGLSFTLLPVAVLVGALSDVALRGDILPRWLGISGAGVAVALLVVASAMFARSGPLAPNAPLSIAGLGVLVAWLIALWATLWTRPTT